MGLTVLLLALLAPQAQAAEEQQNPERVNYQTARIASIKSLATFSDEEIKLVETELEKYDLKRFEAWEESHALVTKLSKTSAPTQEEYRTTLVRLNELEQVRQRARETLINELMKSLTPEQVYAVYVGMRGNNVRVGHGIRHRGRVLPARR